MTKNRLELIKECEGKLMDLKYRYQFSLAELSSNNNTKNLIDNSDGQSSEQLKMRMQQVLPEIYKALDRIKDGTYK